MEYCAKAVTAWLVRWDAIDSDDSELYEYAIYSILFTFSPLLFAIVVGFFLGRPKECMVIILPFLFIRKFSGGFHAKKAWICFVCSSVLLVLCTVISSCIKSSPILWMVTIAAMISLMLCSPIDSENRRLSEEEKKCCKIATIIIVFFFGILDFVLYLCQKETYAVCISIGIILTAGLQIPCMLKKAGNK